MRGAARRFQDLIVWQKAHAFALMVYKMTTAFPKHELFGLSSQLRRAAVSVPSNIVEGFKKRGRADKLKYMNIAEASLEECRYYLILAQDLTYADASLIHPFLEEVSKLLYAYSTAIRNSPDY